MSIDGLITTNDAASLTGYSVAYIRQLARSGRVRSVKAGRDWLVNRDDLMDHKRAMDTLGTEKHNPWRDDLSDGRGRRNG